MFLRHLSIKDETKNFLKGMDEALNKKSSEWNETDKNFIREATVVYLCHKQIFIENVKTSEIKKITKMWKDVDLEMTKNFIKFASKKENYQKINEWIKENLPEEYLQSLDALMTKFRFIK